MKFIYHYIAILSLLFIGLTALGQDELTPYLKTAAENNPSLKAKFNDYMAAMAHVPQVGALPDPVIAFGIFSLPVETRVGPQQFNASLTQMFPWFGLLSAQEDLASERAKTKWEIFQDTKSKLFYDVKTTYYHLYFIDRSIFSAQENIEILQTFRQLALIKFESGKSSAVDELRIEMELADLQNKLAYLSDTKQQLQVQFNNLLNVHADAEVNIPVTLWADELIDNKPALLDSISNQNHQLKQIEHRMFVWEKQEIVAQKTGMPDFVFGLNYIAVGKSDNPNLPASESGKDALMLPTIGISLPINRKKYKAMVEEALKSLDAAGFEKEEKRNQLSTLFEISYRDYEDAKRRVILYEKQKRMANQAMDILLAEYSTDGTDFEEVLRMERKVLNYQLELHKARSDQNTAFAFISYLKGN